MMRPGKDTLSLYPLLLDPIFKYRIWGGRKLGTALGKKLPPQEPIGESWEVSCRNGDNNVISNGHLAGKTLADVLETDREALLGASLGDSLKFPLLNKFIDANDLLSVQVHPTENLAAKTPGAEAKTEAWYIIHADPGATLIKGLKPGVTPDAFERAIRDNTVPSLLNSFPVETGDMVFVPAGCVHAMGKGLVICEIQQNSDTTYRVYDWGRVDAAGKPRQLHVQQALAAINFKDRSPDKVASIAITEGKNKRTFLAACPYFAMQVLLLEKSTVESTGKRRFESLMVLSGRGAIRTEAKRETSISTGDSILVPACVGSYMIDPSPRCTMLKIFVPDIDTEIVKPLRARGIAEEAIRAVVFE
ncbi:MAG: mannose-6-phosphate isomerase [Candidatus Abyssobacteria bacterium SURF_17]|uniref:Phosphohexomutase n=1 Tax=Candidatus Abyssobacteria bacterium SURF_17 TaxID=2093361 RepID=A0A419F146_9BACT|nr:MAG: mannose-6-phosphate isomerase [Candidatus Abyssubacteria bacterium SURF_17]